MNPIVHRPTVPVRATAQCPDPSPHTHSEDEDLGYTAWHEWAKQMSKTHRQKRCPNCGLYRVWAPKGDS